MEIVKGLRYLSHDLEEEYCIIPEAAEVSICKEDGTFNIDVKDES